MTDIANPRMEAARALLDRDYVQPLTLHRIARHVGMPSLRLNQEFERTYHETPRRYLLRLRMEAAQRLLAAGLDEDDVATQVGYSRVRYFILDYRRWFGVMPKAPAPLHIPPPTRPEPR